MEQALCISFASQFIEQYDSCSLLLPFLFGSCVEIKCLSDKKDSKEEEFISIAFAELSQCIELF